MKFKTLQIVWHEKQPVFTAEFLSPDVLATGGADKAIRVTTKLGDPTAVTVTVQIWRVSCHEDAGPAAVSESELLGVNGAVNCIRRSPKDEVFASGGDGGEVIVWKRNPSHDTERENDVHARPWRPMSFLRGHANDVFDMAWSSDGTSLATVSLEGVTIVWDVLRERAKIRLCDHHHYVQGVAWDPFNHFLVTQGGDRRCKIYTRSNESHAKKETAGKSAQHWRVGRTLFKTKSMATTAEQATAREQKDFMFHDDTLTSFFRRLDWSPDGSFLVIPAGLRRFSGEDPSASHVAYIYNRGKWSNPVACLSGVGEPFVAVRCCPMLFEKCLPGDDNTWADLPYNIVFACATLHSVILYNSSQLAPIAFFGGLHYSEVTDMAWTDDGSYLAISSRDGYCSVVHFEAGDLGIPLDLSAMKATHNAASAWFEALEEIRQRSELLSAKRQVRSQPETNEEQSPRVIEAESQTSCLRRERSSAQPRIRRRITPVAVQPVQDEEPITKPEDQGKAIPDLLTADRSFRDDLSKLRDLAAGTGSIQPKKKEPKKNALVDLLAMSKSYANARFGNKDGDRS